MTTPNSKPGEFDLIVLGSGALFSAVPAIKP
jgi:hypothetical protein